MAANDINPILSPLTRDANRFTNSDLAQQIQDISSGEESLSGVGLGIVQTYDATNLTATVLLESGKVSTLDNGLGSAVAENDRVVYSLYKGSKVNGAIVGILDLITSGGGGGSDVYLSTVTSSTAQYLTGTATLSVGGSISFVNGTNSFLVSGDEVVVADVTAFGYVAVGIVSKIAGTTTVIPQPITSLSSTFPIRLDNLTFPITDRVIHDYNNYLSQTGDTIYDQDSLNGFTIPTTTNFNLFNPPYDFTFLQPNGRLISVERLAYSSGISPATILMQYRNLGDPSWTVWTPSVVPTSSNRFIWTFDESNGALWLAIGAGSGDAVRFLPTDSTPVELSSFYTLIGTVNPGTPQAPLLSADNDVLYINATGSAMANAILFYKPSDDSTSFTNTGVIVPRAVITTTIDTNKNYYFLIQSTTTNTYHIIKFIYTGGPIVDYDTGIPLYSVTGEIDIKTIEALDSGIILLGGWATDVFLGAGSTGDFIPVIASFNFITTNYIYYDDIYITPTGSPNTMRNLKEVVQGTVRFTAGAGSGSETWVYELTGF